MIEVLSLTNRNAINSNQDWQSGRRVGVALGLAIQPKVKRWFEKNQMARNGRDQWLGMFQRG